MNLLELAERVRKANISNNRLDVEVEIALFEPDEFDASIRANAAGTKVIYTDHAGNDETCWAHDWTSHKRRSKTIAALRSRHAMQQGEEG